MALVQHQPYQLLYYRASSQVLICKECRYAIQPSACSRHLKDLHQIYRSERQELMRYIAGLELANPDDVDLPKPYEGPVPFLPIEDGYACEATGCFHLCVTEKRMKSHWSTTHCGASTNPSWRPVSLQTFFRGNKLRYFIVAKEVESSPDRQHIPETDTDSSDQEVQTCNASFADEVIEGVDESMLMEHFQNYVCQDLGDSPQSKEVWKTVIPQLASKHKFLQHGILAYSALHFAYINPTQRPRYHIAAACHQNRALPEFRHTLSNVNESNCNATLAFSQLLVMHCFAAQYQDETLFLVNWKDEPVLPEWLHVVRASCTIFGEALEFIKKGPLMPLILDGSVLAADKLPDLESDKLHYALHLNKLMELPLQAENWGAAQPNEEVNSSFYDTLSKLCVAFRLAQSSKKLSFWAAVHIWPARVSQQYLETLRNKDPSALILLAHFCILLGPLESHWFMHSFRRRLLSRIYSHLEPEWRYWLEWPIEEIGLE